MPRKYTPEERIAAFWAKVDKSAPGDGCWPRAGGKHHWGYGLFWDGKRQMAAHRYAYELTYGPVPEGLFICHKCDFPACVRPDHLFAGTAKENTHDMMAKGREGFTYTTRPELIPRGDKHYTRRNPELVRRGEQLTQMKLTDAQVRAIRERHEAGGITQRALCAEYGISPAQMSRIVNYRDRHG